MRTNKKFTYEVLNGHYESESGAILADYLTDNIIIYLSNDRTLYNEVRNNTRRKPEPLAWSAFTELINDILRDWHPGFYASSEQLKTWLKDHGAGYEVLAPVVEYIKDTRAEA
jgi:hypothetical protein